jgi:HAD superfamily hydrolase (TIGR01450 family)
MARRDPVGARLARVKGFVLDMDGTLVLGDSRNRGLRALPGAVQFIQHLRTQRLPFVAFTNGTVRPPGAYVHELGEAGLELDESEIMTPASVAADFLSRRGFRRVMILGGEGVSAPVEQAGLEIVRPPECRDVDAIFVGWFHDFTMRDIEAACEAVWSGAKLYAASLVPFFATAGGRTLGTSCAIAGAIERITGCRAKALGKPSLEGLRCASQRLGIAPPDLAVIGDDPALEVLMAHRGKALAVGVTSGVAKAADFAAVPRDRRAHLVVENIGEFLARHRAAI